MLKDNWLEGEASYGESVMKIMQWIEGRSLARYELGRYTTAYGHLIFDSSKGGTIRDTVSLRFNKNLSEIVDLGGGATRESCSFINFYIDRESGQINLIDFVIMHGFRVISMDDLVFPKCALYHEPIIDTTTWVSPFGMYRHYANDEVRYLYTEYQVDVLIETNGADKVRLVFGELKHWHCLNEEVVFYTDDRSNLTAIAFKGAGAFIQKVQKG